MKHCISGRRVLVVEDDYFLAGEIAATLRRAGADVIGPVSNVRDAMIAIEEAPDVAVLDVQLGYEDSHPVADELARLGVPFVFATGSPASIALAHSARIVCLKPVPNRIMIQALAHALIPAFSK